MNLDLSSFSALFRHAWHFRKVASPRFQSCQRQSSGRLMEIWHPFSSSHTTLNTNNLNDVQLFNFSGSLFVILQKNQNILF